MTQAERNWWEIDESRPYGFVSYAHYDKKRVDPIAYQLIRDGYPVWMDHDIVSGADWSEYIADHLKNASYAIIFLSDASIHSGNVRDEINFARNEGKPLIVVYLEDVSQTMPKGLHLSLDRFQAVNAYSHSFEQTIHDLEEAVTFRRQRKQSADKRQTSKKKSSVHKKPSGRKKRKKNGVIIGVIAAVIVIILLIAILAMTKLNTHKTKTPEISATPQTTEETTTDDDNQDTDDNQNTTQNSQKNVQTPQQNATDYTFSTAVLSSRFNMSPDNFRNFVAQQGVDVNGLTSKNGNVILSLTDSQKNTLIQTLENNASSATSQLSGDVTSASFENGYTGVDLTLSTTEVSSDDQAMANNLKAYGILIQSLNDSSASFKVTFNDQNGNLISTETY